MVNFEDPKQTNPDPEGIKKVKEYFQKKVAEEEAIRAKLKKKLEESIKEKIAARAAEEKKTAAELQRLRVEVGIALPDRLQELYKKLKDKGTLSDEEFMEMGKLRDAQRKKGFRLE